MGKLVHPSARLGTYWTGQCLAGMAEIPRTNFELSHNPSSRASLQFEPVGMAAATTTDLVLLPESRGGLRARRVYPSRNVFGKPATVVAGSLGIYCGLCGGFRVFGLESGHNLIGIFCHFGSLADLFQPHDFYVLYSSNFAICGAVFDLLLGHTDGAVANERRQELDRSLQSCAAAFSDQQSPLVVWGGSSRSNFLCGGVFLSNLDGHDNSPGTLLLADVAQIVDLGIRLGHDSYSFSSSMALR